VLSAQWRVALWEQAQTAYQTAKWPGHAPIRIVLRYLAWNRSDYTFEVGSQAQGPHC
jgi:hypothetical protein